MLRQMKHCVAAEVKGRMIERQIRQERIYEERLILRDFPTNMFSPLTKGEMELVNEKWGGCGAKPLSFKTYELLKHINGFDERYLSHGQYLPLISHRLGSYHYTKFFEDKGLLGFLPCDSRVHFPYCHIRNICGHFYNNEMEQISREDAVRLLVEADDFLVKPSVESSGGHGVRIYHQGELDLRQRRCSIERMMSDYGCGYVVQSLLRQHAFTAQFNPTSVNTYRIATLYLNGKATLCNSYLRMGGAGAEVDNACSGGCFVGSYENGRLKPKAYNYHGQTFEASNGIKFSSCVFENYASMIETIVECHKRMFALCPFIGWDVCVCEDGSLCIIEVNTSQHGIINDQMVGGPVFGERTDEVIDYVKQQPFVYHRALLSY